MYITAANVIAAAGLLAAIISIGTVGYKIIKWLQRQDKQDHDIKELREEQCLLTYGVLACLKGLSEQGCDGPVSEAICKIENHINQKAHKQ